MCDLVNKRPEVEMLWRDEDEDEDEDGGGGLGNRLRPVC